MEESELQFSLLPEERFFGLQTSYFLLSQKGEKQSHTKRLSWATGHSPVAIEGEGQTERSS